MTLKANSQITLSINAFIVINPIPSLPLPFFLNISLPLLSLYDYNYYHYSLSISLDDEYSLRRPRKWSIYVFLLFTGPPFSPPTPFFSLAVIVVVVCLPACLPASFLVYFIAHIHPNSRASRDGFVIAGNVFVAFTYSLIPSPPIHPSIHLLSTCSCIFLVSRFLI